MEILGRTVEAIKYQGIPLVNVYVNRKSGDCQRETNPNYVCIDNCEGKLVIARFIQKQPLSVKALVPKELQILPQFISAIASQDLRGLELMAAQRGYELRNVNKGKVLYFNEQPVASYTPCGFAMDQKLWNSEVAQTVAELVERVDEVYQIAQDRPLEFILDDKALATQLSNPVLLSTMATICGSEGIKLVRLIRSMKAERN